MARDKESMQDNALWAMEKINRQNPDNGNKPLTLAEQLKEMAKSPDQKRRELSKYDWTRDLQDHIAQDKRGPGNKLYQYVTNRYKEEIEKFRASGAPYSEVSKFISSKGEEFMNR